MPPFVATYDAGARIDAHEKEQNRYVRSIPVLRRGASLRASVPLLALQTLGRPSQPEVIAEEMILEKFAGMVAPSLEIVVDRRPDVLVVSLAGELDFACAGALGELAAVKLSPLDRDVVLDLARLDFIDLAGARLVGAAAGVVARSGWRCTVTSPSPLAAWVIEIAGFADLLAGACRLRSVVHGEDAVTSDRRSRGRGAARAQHRALPVGSGVRWVGAPE
jgi:anti-anti-sigma factor